MSLAQPVPFEGFAWDVLQTAWAKHGAGGYRYRMEIDLLISSSHVDLTSGAGGHQALSEKTSTWGQARQDFRQADFGPWLCGKPGTEHDPVWDIESAGGWAPDSPTTHLAMSEARSILPEPWRPGNRG